MYIDPLEIVNFRCIDRASYGSPPRMLRRELSNVNLLVGDNGTGKTWSSAVALAVLAPVLGYSGFYSRHLLRRGRDAATIKATVVPDRSQAGTSRGGRARGGDTRKHDVEELKTEDYSPIGTTSSGELRRVLLVGYGASRRIDLSEAAERSGLKKMRGVRFQRVAGLFEDHVTLTPPSSWLPALQRSRSRRVGEVKSLINDCLPETARFQADEEDGEYLLKVRGGDVPLSAMSDGFRGLVGWVFDLLFHLTNVCPDESRLRDIRGVVLLDEVDLHLHPRWHREVVPRISAAFPNLQFLLTTHSPIVTGTVPSRQVHYLRIDESGDFEAEQFEENVQGLSAGQILASPFFGMETTRPPHVERAGRPLAAGGPGRSRGGPGVPPDARLRLHGAPGMGPHRFPGGDTRDSRKGDDRGGREPLG